MCMHAKKGLRDVLNAFIIEQVQRRERERARQNTERPFLEVPRPHPDDERRHEKNRQSRQPDDEQPSRGVIVIQL